MLTLDGKIYKLVTTFANYSILNGLWIVFSLPLFTVFPAFVAMLAIIRDWSNEKELPITATYLMYFKKYFKKSCIIGFIQLAVVSIFLIDFHVILQLPKTWDILILPIFAVMSLLFLLMSIYMYPLLVSFTMTGKQLIRNSFYLSISKPIPGLFVVILVGLMLILSFFIRFLFLLCTFSVCALIVHKMIHTSMTKFPKMIVQEK
ncbi:YesL family protein [Neobacillus sp. D3-1R]|uniref:YesL family protein n=1 Tax=Neobacillus sp. D3-1R TaxID=3445778 RepID=UPI003F9EE4B5